MYDSSTKGPSRSFRTVALTTTVALLFVVMAWILFGLWSPSNPPQLGENGFSAGRLAEIPDEKNTLQEVAELEADLQPTEDPMAELTTPPKPVLYLVGVLKSNEPQNSRAIISVDRKPSGAMYFPEQEIGGTGYVLASVEKDHVVLRRSDGRLEQLPLDVNTERDLVALGYELPEKSGNSMDPPRTIDQVAKEKHFFETFGKAASKNAMFRVGPRSAE